MISGHIDTRGRAKRRKEKKKSERMWRDPDVREHMDRCYVGAIINYQRLLQ